MWLWLSNSYEHVVQKHVGAVPFSTQRGRYHSFFTGTIHSSWIRLPELRYKVSTVLRAIAVQLAIWLRISRLAYA